MSILAVQEADKDPGHLYFYPTVSIVVAPKDETGARQQFESIASTLRIALKKDHPEVFNEFFNRLLRIAQGAFQAGGFNEHALDDLTQFKREVVHAVAKPIKAKYITSFTKWLVGFLIAFTVLLCVFSYYGIDKITEKEYTFSICKTLVMALASLFGLWFSAVYRSNQISYDNLVSEDANLTTPWIRIGMVQIGIIFFAILFQLDFVNISLAKKYDTSMIASQTLIAIAVGFLLGCLDAVLPQKIMDFSKKVVPND
jgi:hypothetical protein